MERALLQGLKEHGYVPGQNLAIEFPSAYGKPDRLPALAAELVQAPVDLILVPGLARARAAQAATSTIPILGVGLWGNPVEWGLVDPPASHGAPGRAVNRLDEARRGGRVTVPVAARATLQVERRMEFERFLAVLRALEHEGVEYVLVGATALGLHGIIRATEDMDLFVRPTVENVERLRRALRTVWDDPEIEQIRPEDLDGEFPTIRYGPPGEDFVIDLLSRLGSAFGFDDLDAEVVMVEGIRVCVATPATLYRMKKDTVRPIDRADAAALKEKFGLRDG